MHDEVYSQDPTPLFNSIGRWTDQVEQLPQNSEPGSDLAADAMTSPVFQVGQAAKSAAAGAVDHLQLMKNQLTVAKTLHPYALATLGRVAIENAALYVWLLAPDESPQRVARRLRLAWQEVRDLEELLEIDPGFLVASQPSVPERRQVLRELASTLGVEESAVTGRFSYSKVVRRAGDLTRVGGEVIELLWRVGSGVAHSRDWARHSWLNKEVISQEGENVTLRLTTDVDQVTQFMWAAGQLLLLGDDLFQRRSVAPAAKN